MSKPGISGVNRPSTHWFHTLGITRHRRTVSYCLNRLSSSGPASDPLAVVSSPLALGDPCPRLPHGATGQGDPRFLIPLVLAPIRGGAHGFLGCATLVLLRRISSASISHCQPSKMRTPYQTTWSPASESGAWSWEDQQAGGP